MMETLPCSCSQGALEIEVLAFGKWRVEKVLTACPECDSTDLEKARQEQAKEPPKREG